MLVFCYGSNMFLPRLRRRAPSARVVAVGELRGHVLAFHKRGMDDSGKCNAWRTSDPGDTVRGALVRVSAPDLARLDRAEGLGRGYDRDRALVTTPSGQIDAAVYVASPVYIDDRLRPFDWYHELVLRGAVQHGLADDYIARIRRVSAIEDPDPRRQALNREILSESPGSLP